MPTDKQETKKDTNNNEQPIKRDISRIEEVWEAACTF